MYPEERWPKKFREGPRTRWGRKTLPCIFAGHEYSLGWQAFYYASLGEWWDWWQWLECYKLCGLQAGK